MHIDVFICQCSWRYRRQIILTATFIISNGTSWNLKVTAQQPVETSQSISDIASYPEGLCISHNYLLGAFIWEAPRSASRPEPGPTVSGFLWRTAFDSLTRTWFLKVLLYAQSIGYNLPTHWSLALTVCVQIILFTFLLLLFFCTYLLVWRSKYNLLLVLQYFHNTRCGDILRKVLRYKNKNVCRCLTYFCRLDIIVTIWRKWTGETCEFNCVF